MNHNESNQTTSQPNPSTLTPTKYSVQLTWEEAKLIDFLRSCTFSVVEVHIINKVINRFIYKENRIILNIVDPEVLKRLEVSNNG